MRTRLALLVLACAALSPLAPARGQDVDRSAAPLAPPGTAFTYQGRLLDAGAPAGGAYDLQVALFDAATTPPGVQMGETILKDDVAVAGGLVTVELDFAGATSTGQPRWLEIAVRPGDSLGAFTTVWPRQPVRPAPSAHYSLSGVATDVQCSGCIGVADLAGGAAAAGRVLTATGVSTMAWQAPVWPTGSGSAGQVALWSSASTLSGNAGLIWDGANGRLGIGTSTPHESLEVAGNLRLPETTSSSTGVLWLGARTFLHAYSISTFLGINAGNFTMGGTGNEGKNNTGLGFGALSANGTGHSNTAVGDSSLGSNTSGSFNAAVGSLSLTTNTTGAYNSAVGHMSLYLNTTGSDNTAVGEESLWGNTTAGRNTAVGTHALESQSYDNGGTAWDANNTAVGYYALYSNEPTSTTVGRRNTAVGAAAGDSQTGTNNTFLGYDADASVNLLSNAMALGAGARVDASNKVVIGNTSVTSIGGYAPWSDYSDARGKRDIRDLEFGLDLVLRLRPVEFRLEQGNGKLNFGFIAQEVEALLGEDINVVDVGRDPDRTLSLRYSELIAPLVKAVQEQQEEIAAQRRGLEQKDRHVERLESLIVALAERVTTLERSPAGPPR